MKNSEFKIGDHILVHGNKGIVREITKCNECILSFGDRSMPAVMSEEVEDRTVKNGYTVERTGRTATYFKVSFENEETLSGTVYDLSEYGCLDEYENYFTW